MIIKVELKLWTQALPSSLNWRVRLSTLLSNFRLFSRTSFVAVRNSKGKNKLIQTISQN